MTVPTEHLLALAGILFSVGVAGFFLRRNLIVEKNRRGSEDRDAIPLQSSTRVPQPEMVP